MHLILRQLVPFDAAHEASEHVTRTRTPPSSPQLRCYFHSVHDSFLPPSELKEYIKQNFVHVECEVYEYSGWKITCPVDPAAGLVVFDVMHFA